MTYELANQLQNAGFPQGQGIYIGTQGTVIGTDIRALQEFPYAAYVPNLSELVEAIGDDFDLLSHDPRGVIESRRGIHRREETWFACTWSRKEGVGHTALEALAH